MTWMAGGDPLTNWIPDHLSVEVRRFLLDCLEDSPSRRPQDAWALHEQFQYVLAEAYGPPRFCHLSMS